MALLSPALTPKSFLEIYARLITEGYEVLSILISEKLSGTIELGAPGESSVSKCPDRDRKFGHDIPGDGLCCFTRRGGVEPGSRPEGSPSGSRKRPPEGGCRLRGGHA